MAGRQTRGTQAQELARIIAPVPGLQGWRDGAAMNRTITIAMVTRIDNRLAVLREREKELCAAWLTAKTVAHGLPWGAERRAAWRAYDRFNRLRTAAETLRRFRDVAEGYCPDCGDWIERCVMYRVCAVTP
jgi:hypothetical protein